MANRLLVALSYQKQQQLITKVFFFSLRKVQFLSLVSQKEWTKMFTPRKLAVRHFAAGAGCHPVQRHKEQLSCQPDWIGVSGGWYGFPEH